MLKTGLVLTLFFGIAATTLPTEVQAQQQRGTQAQQDACGRDVNRFCRKLINEGDFVILRCLQQNRSRLSRACRGLLEAHGR